MTPETVVEIGQDALVVTLALLLVLLVPTLVVGLLVSMLQAATQINEMTLSFIPKLLVTLGCIDYRLVRGSCRPWWTTRDDL